MELGSKPQVELDNVEDILPLTPVQQGILFHTLEATEEALYFQQVVLVLSGDIDSGSLQAAASELLHLHPLLRSVILWEGLENPVQVVRRELAAGWEQIHLQSAASPACETQMEEFLQQDRRRGFNLTSGPLIRFTLLQFGPEHARLVVSFHHIVLDGWSLRCLLGDLGQLYQARCEQRPASLEPAPAYRNYIDWLQAQSTSAALEHWREQLRGLEAPTPLPMPAPAVVPGGELHEEQRQSLSGSQVAELTAAAKRFKVTLNTLVQAAWALVLARYSSQEKVLYGTSLAGRPHDLPGVESMLGMFLQTVPVVVPVEPQATVDSWLGTLQTNQLAAAEYGHCGLTEIGKCSELPAGSEMFESLLVFENLSPVGVDQSRFGDLVLQDVQFLERSNYPLALLVVPGDSWELIALHDCRRFGAQQVRRLLASLETALMSLATAKSSTPVGALDCLGAAQCDQLLAWGQGAQNPDTRDSWLTLLSESVSRYPERTALSAGDKTWTYAALDAEANRLAQRYIRCGLCPGDMVGVAARRTPETLLAVIALLRAGGVYVPLEPEQPVARLARITSNAGLKWVLGEIDDVDLSIPRLNAASADDGTGVAQALPDISGDDPAYVIYTSGSTGMPRGVVVTHRNLLLSTSARALYYKQSVDSFLLLSSLAFDSSVAGIFWTLAAGGTLVLPEPGRHDDVEHLLRVAQRHSVSHLLCVPSLYQLLLDCADGRLDSLRCAIVAGEVCPPRLVQAHRLALAAARFFNEYGPTEATVWASVAELTELTTSGTVPIGKPIPGVHLYIVDTQQRLCPVGVAGELCIAGPTVASGYLHDVTGTAQSFVNDPFAPSLQRMYRTGDRARWGEDGQVYYIGREDNQIKIRGRRVDTGEIEFVLGEHASVRENAVLLREVCNTTEVSLQDIELALAALDIEDAERMLAEVEEVSLLEEHRERGANFEIILQLGDGCLAPPRDNQRRWLIRQLLQEMSDDVTQLSEQASRFVPGVSTFLEDTPDVSGLDLDAEDIMEDWQTPVLQAMAEVVCASHGHILEIGFGRGISAGMIQDCGVRAHTIVEANLHCIRRFFDPWRAQYPRRDIRMVHDSWQDASARLEKFDGVFFHTAARNVEELFASTVGQITYAEHFFPTASQLLLPGGVFTYLANEIDSLSRSHQRLLLEHFSEFSVRKIDQLQIPTDTRDVWWAESMVVVAAVK